MLIQTRQLLLSSSRNEFSLEDIKNGIDDLVSITPMGIGYINYGIYHCDYISEVIMDCTVDDRIFAPSQFGGLKGRFDALREFLRVLAELDYNEVCRFMDNADKEFGGEGRKEYTSIYGFNTISFAIRESVIRSTLAIFRSIINDAEKHREEDMVNFKRPYEEILLGMYDNHVYDQVFLYNLLNEYPNIGIGKEALSL